MQSDRSGSGSAFAAYVAFRSSLLHAAASHIERIDTAYAQSVRDELARDSDPRAYTATPLAGPAVERFSRFRRLLNATYEVELYYRQVNAGVILLALPGAHTVPPELVEFQVQPAEQFFHHLQAWSISLGSLFDRAENLATLSVRQLIKPTGSATWQADERGLKAAVKAAQDKHRALRNSFAHQGGVFDQLASSGVWEQVAALGRWLDTSVACDFMYANHSAYVARTTAATATAIRDLDAVIGDLNSAIDWDAVEALRL